MLAGCNVGFSSFLWICCYKMSPGGELPELFARPYIGPWEVVEVGDSCEKLW